MHNPVKAKLRRGEVTLGVSIGTYSLDLVEMISKMNFDWIWFDSEHSPVNSEMLQAMLQVARGGHATPIVRVPWNDQVYIKKTLDVGAQGLIIPWVNNRAQAEAAVRAAKYPPQGIRGFGPRWVAVSGGNVAEYARTANDEGLIIVQIETREAVDNLEEIITTPGVDAYLIGPSDLAASMGHLGDIAYPEVQQTIDDIIERGKKAGVPGGYAGAPAEECEKRIAQGLQIITVGSDLGFVRQSAQVVLERLGRTLMP
jgi:2-keto-3-deoxy-L-rhamnonate aldolase RhmA